VYKQNLRRGGHSLSLSLSSLSASSSSSSFTPGSDIRLFNLYPVSNRLSLPYNDDLHVNKGSDYLQDGFDPVLEVFLQYFLVIKAIIVNYTSTGKSKISLFHHGDTPQLQ
jgi:hypothetical protein